MGKNIKHWENTGIFWIGKQPVFGWKIGKIKSLWLNMKMTIIGQKIMTYIAKNLLCTQSE